MFWKVSVYLGLVIVTTYNTQAYIIKKGILLVYKINVNDKFPPLARL